MRAIFRALIVVAALGAMVACSATGGGGEGGGGRVPGAGQAFVTGEVARLVADDAQAGQPLASPFTLTATVRGGGNATIENALVNGRRSTISWATGTPLPITGAGGLDLGPVHVEVDGRGVTWALDGAARPFLPGSYHAGAPVAVGAGGIAAPRDGVNFTADDQTVLTSRGGVVVHVPAQTVDLRGPGKVSVAGRLEVQTPSSRRRAGAVTFGPGPFEVTLTPTGGGGLTIDSVLQGAFTST